MAKIQLFIAGEIQGQYSLDNQPEVTVGRSSKCDIVIKNTSVSRHHCTFRLSQEGWLEGQWTVIDADSANGTFVNGEAVKEHVLQHKDRVVIGQHTLLFDQYGAADGEKTRPKETDVKPPKTDLLYSDDLLKLLERSQKNAMALVLGGHQIVPLAKEKIVIGSGPDCDLRISGLFVRAHQAWVVACGQGHKIIHQGGPRALYVNHKKQTETLLNAGDCIEIAGNRIAYGSL